MERRWNMKWRPGLHVDLGLWQAYHEAPVVGDKRYNLVMTLVFSYLSFWIQGFGHGVKDLVFRFLGLRV